MVPFHESDLAENRWNEEEWRQFELWEEIEKRRRFRRTMMIAGTFTVFCLILSIPIVKDRQTKWKAAGIARKIAVEVQRMKVDAAALRTPLRIALASSPPGTIRWEIQRVSSCAEATGEVWTQGGWGDPEGEFVLLGREQSRDLGLERIVEEFCYDPVHPVESPSPYAMGVLSAKDLSERRLDRIALLNFSGPFAEIDLD